MFKQRYVEFEKKSLEDAVFSPYELTQAGLNDLKRTIVMSIVALTLFCLIILMFARHGSFYDWGYSIGQAFAGHPDGSYLPLLYGAITLTVFLGTLKVFTKACEALTETGLFMRVSVSDALQDEWEIAQKRKSFAFAYEAVGIALVTAFIVSLLVCLGHIALVGDLPKPPRFGTAVVISIVTIWTYCLLPISYLAWTLEPVEEDSLDGPITKPAPKPKPVLTGKAKWKKRFWDLLPYAVGLAIGVTWALNN